MSITQKIARALAITTRSKRPRAETAAEFTEEHAAAALRCKIAKQKSAELDKILIVGAGSLILQEASNYHPPRVSEIRRIVRAGRRMHAGKPVCTLAAGVAQARAWLCAREAAHSARDDVRRLYHRDQQNWNDNGHGTWGHQRMRNAAELRALMIMHREYAIKREIESGVNGKIIIRWVKSLAGCAVDTTRKMIRGRQWDELHARIEVIAQAVPVTMLPCGRRTLDGIVTLGAVLRQQRLAGGIKVWSAAWIVRPGRAIEYVTERGVILTLGTYSRHVCLDGVADKDVSV